MGLRAPPAAPPVWQRSVPWQQQLRPALLPADGIVMLAGASGGSGIVFVAPEAVMVRLSVQQRKVSFFYLQKIEA